MAQQVLDRRRLPRCAPGAAGFSDLQVGQRWKVFRHRIAQQDAPLLEEGHDRSGGHHLGHGGDGEDGVGLERISARRVAIANGLEVREPACARDGDDGPGKLSGLDVAAQRFAEAAQPCGGEAYRLRFDTRKHGLRHGATSSLALSAREHNARRLERKG